MPPAFQATERKLRRTSGRRSGTRHGRTPERGYCRIWGGSARIHFREGRGPDAAQHDGHRELGQHLRTAWRLLRRCVSWGSLMDRGASAWRWTILHSPSSRR